MPVVDLCAAVDRQRNGCCLPQKQGARWCERHNQERLRLYLGYKSDHRALESFPNGDICTDLKKVRVGSSADVKKWNEAIRLKCNLLNRCIDARARFSERFFGNDMDFGHKIFHEKLRVQRKELETCLVAVERRGYELMLAAQNALWVLESDDASASVDYCPESSNMQESLSPPPSIDDVEPTIEEDPLEAFYNAKIEQLRFLIKGFLAIRMAPKTSRWHEERRDILWTYVRRVVFQHTSLMLLAQHFENVEAFLASDLDVTALEKLWNTMNSSTSPLFCAVEDVLRTNKEGKRVTILGGYVYQTSGNNFRSLTRTWYHMFALGACMCCIRRNTCSTIDQIIELEKYYTLTRAEVHGQDVDFGERAELGQLRLCGVTPILPEDMMRREIAHPEVLKSKCPHARKCAHWEEKQDFSVLNFALSLNDPRAQTFLNACRDNSDFAVMWRKGPDGPISEPPGGLCSYRYRQATSRARLRYAEWDDVVFRTSLLEESCYQLDDAQLGDCYQLAIADKVIRPPREFVQCFVRICYDVYAPGANTPSGLFNALAKSYIEQGTLEFHDGRIVPPIVENELEGWARLWKR